MLSTKFKKVIKFICSELQGREIEWAFAGNTNMILQGMDVFPADISIITGIESLPAFEEIFRDFVFKKDFQKYLNAGENSDIWELIMDVEGIDVIVLAGKENDVHYSKIHNGGVKIINFEGLQAPCLSLELEAQVCRETNLGYKAELIKDFIDRNPSLDY